MNTLKPTYNLNALSMAYKAGACMVGEKKVLAHLKDMKVLILASDAGPNITDKVNKKSKYYEIPLIHVWDKATLAQILPKTPVLMGITDASFLPLLFKGGI